MYTSYMKTCTRCNKNKLKAEFNVAKKNKDGLHSYCRDCQKKHYLDNKTRHMKNVKKSKESYLNIVRANIAASMSQGCIDCGNRDIRVLEFDHVRGSKVDGIGRMIRMGYALPKIMEEISKCEVRCKNCHAIKTYERIGNTWHAQYMPL